MSRRPAIPRAIKDGVLKEYNHKCAKCSAERPHIHHIDENPQNNDPGNLIPLCPNCHLTDQHDASNSIPIAKLQFFRAYKHRNILQPQFNAIFVRAAFLRNPSEFRPQELQRMADELCAFIRYLPMGAFFSDQIARLLRLPPVMLIMGNEQYLTTQDVVNASEERRRESIAIIVSARPAVERLIVELLDFQQWD